MSEAPRIELPTSDLHDLHLSANQFQTSNGNGYGNGNATARPSTDVDSKLAQSAVNAKDSIVQTAQQAMAAASSHPAVQNTKEAVLNGPVAQNVMAEGAKTRDEFADLANSRQTPDYKAATGQSLTHYHSMFYRLLSWKNPRATGIAFALTVVFIFAARYLNIISYIFKGLYLTLGATATAEVAGQLAFGRGLTSQFRPRQYFTIPKASLERLLDDVEQLINFFVIESQRILFAENVYATVAAFFASLISYFLIKLVPLWGLALIATLVSYLGPLVYVQNQEVIDAQLAKGRHIATQQATQLKDLASQQAGNAAKTVQGYTQQYTTKAQETINQYRGRSSSPELKKEAFPAPPASGPNASSAFPAAHASGPATSSAFPAAPKHDLAFEREPVAEPLL